MDWDDAYANGAYIQGAAEYPPRWDQAAAAFRAAQGTRVRLDVPYGDSPRERLDIFLPEARARGLAVFVHGGYWKAFGKDTWSHLAAGALAEGLAVCLPQYTLCPEVRIAEITRQIARAIAFAAEGIDGPIHLAGHSAGGHLVCRMACQDSPLAHPLQLRLGSVLSISGVHDLRPLLMTEMNETLRLDLAEAQAESPALLAPLPGTRLVCWVGADERPEFVRQSALLANIWTGLGADTRAIEEPGRHHFNVIDGLADPASALMQAWLAIEGE